MGMVSISGLSLNVSKGLSVGYDIMAPKPSSQVISGFGHVSGATLPRPYRARDLVAMDEVGSGRIPLLECVTYGRRIGFRR